MKAKTSKPAADGPRLYSFQRCRPVKLPGQQWPPPALILPDDLDLIEQGRGGEQQSLLPPEPVDDSRAGRVARLLANVPGVTTADTLPHPPVQGTSRPFNGRPHPEASLLSYLPF